MKVPALHFQLSALWNLSVWSMIISCESFDVQQRQESFTVGDYMTPRDELFVATVNTTIDEGGHC